MSEESFKKSFPELFRADGIYDDWDGVSGYSEDEIEKHCLSKQRVREAIDSVLNRHHNPFDEDVRFARLLKEELRLDK